MFSSTGPLPALRGAFTALVTPFNAGEDLDEPALRRFVEWQVAEGIDGLVPVRHHRRVPHPVRGRARRHHQHGRRRGARRAESPSSRAPAPNVTRTTIAATRRAAELGADAALVVTPYYNKPDQRMLEAHFRAVADEGGLPVVVYNVPSRTGVNVEAATMLRLAEHPRIVAVKEASANLDQMQTILRNRPDGFSVLSGDDSWTLDRPRPRRRRRDLGRIERDPGPDGRAVPRRTGR